VDLVTRTAKKAYIERKIKVGNGIENLLFREGDNDLSGAFRLDRFTSNPSAMAYTTKDNQSAIRHFQAGSTELIEVPTAREKTPIDAELREAVAVGLEATASQVSSLMRNVDLIVGDQSESAQMTKSKQAIDVLRTGIFKARNVSGDVISLDYDHQRDSSQAIVYDFTGVGANMMEALANISKQLDAKGTPKGERCIIMGEDWLSAFGSDSGVWKLNTLKVLRDYLLLDR